MATTYSAYRNQVQRELDRIPQEFLPSVLKMMQAFRESISLPSAEASLRQGLEEARAGATRPVSELWDGLDAE